jgi:hypothetical protein
MRLICLDHRRPATHCKCSAEHVATLTHIVSIHEIKPRWPDGTGTYLSSETVGWGAPSLESAESEATAQIARMAKADAGAKRIPVRNVERIAIIHLACRRCFAGEDPFPINRTGDPDLARRIREEHRASEACPACHGTLRESLYGPEWPEELALSRVPAIRAGLDEAESERETYLAEMRRGVA